MAFELVYTSAQRGLRPGSRGFCTVAYTRGLRPDQVQVLEALSAYRNLFPVHHTAAVSNPIAYSHVRYAFAGRTVSILSRVAPALADHTQRTNKLAHHVVLSARERPAGGPAWLCLQPGFFREAWVGEPRVITEPKPVPTGDVTPAPARTWAACTGDAGWAGVLAYGFLSRPAVPAYVVYAPGLEVLPLLAEALALLPAARRWQVTFNTYFTMLPARATCAWRFCVPDAECLREARRNARTLVLDLTQPLGAPPENAYVTSARTGEPVPAAPEPRAGARAEFVPLPNRHRRTLRMQPPNPQGPDRE